MPEFIVVFDCGDQECHDSLEEAHVSIADHGYDCEWTIYEARSIESSPKPQPEA
jgi:hypothetical protein